VKSAGGTFQVELGSYVTSLQKVDVGSMLKVGLTNEAQGESMVNSGNTLTGYMKDR